MPFNDLEKTDRKRPGQFLAKRRPHPTSAKSSTSAIALSGQSIELLEIRPQWDDPTVIHQRPFAKATYVRDTGLLEDLLDAGQR